MQSSSDNPASDGYRRQGHDPGSRAVEGYAKGPNRRRGCGCWGWAFIALIALVLSALVVSASAFAGWNAGIGVARENATLTSEAEFQEQCERIGSDIDAGKGQLVKTRIDFLLKQTPMPPCLTDHLPRATALVALQEPSPALAPTATLVVTATPQPTVVVVRATATVAAEPPIEYDLDDLLAEAQNDVALQNYQRAIDTLDAIIAIEEDYQRDQIRSMYFAALKAEAHILFRSGRLSEAIIMTGRAVAYGDIAELNYERFIASLYLDGLRLKAANPGESVRNFSSIVYENGLGNYMSGKVIGELQEAHRNYGDVFANQGDHCRARDQYEAALALQPASSSIRRSTVADQRDRASEACDGVPVGPAETTAAVTRPATPAGIGIRPSPAPVGQTG